MKICRKCNQKKDDSAFSVTHRVCKPCRSDIQKASYQANPEPNRKASAKWAKENPEQVKENNAAYCEKNKDRINAQRRERHAKNPTAINQRERLRRKSDPAYRLTRNLRNRFHAAIVGRAQKSAKTVELLGAPWVWVEVHLESLFKTGMTWENYGHVWHVDHARPCASFDLTVPEQQRMCFHWTNLQPLFALDNLRKSDTYDPQNP